METENFRSENEKNHSLDVVIESLKEKKTECEEYVRFRLS